jgi:carbamoyltransferase
MTTIIGYNLSHDSSICIVENGRIRAAAALERSCRLKRGVVAAHDYAPAMATLTREVLAGERLTPDDVDFWIATSTESRNQADEDRLADCLGVLIPDAKRLSLPHPGHHLAHAAAAFYTTDFPQASALVVDAYGSLLREGRERETGFLFRAGEVPQTIIQTVRGHARIAGRTRPDGTIGLPAELSGIGEIYRVITLALGFYEQGTYDDAGKTMGLAPYGKRISERNLFIDVADDELTFDQAADSLISLGLAVRDSTGLQLQPRAPGAALQDEHRNLAAQVQAEFEDACLHLVRKLIDKTGVRTLVLGGGCFLNSVLNARLLREAPIDGLSVFPAATDDGNAAGAALYAHHVLTGRHAGATAPGLRHVYLGTPRLAGADIADMAAPWGVTTIRHASPRAAAAAAAQQIADGKIIGWFGDRGEFGPRALGARSILCHPGILGMKATLNHRVKFRESFRPFAGAVLTERAGKYFEMTGDDSPFMLQVWPVIDAVRDQVSEIVHVDGTCRVQTVDADLPGGLRALLEEFDAATGLPVLLNTSFNLRGMPIVERPEEAIDCLFRSRLDSVFFGVVEILGIDHSTLVPVPDGSPHGKQPPQWLLSHADGQRTIRDIADLIDTEVNGLVDVALDLHHAGLLRWQGVPRVSPPEYPLRQYEASRAACLP